MIKIMVLARWAGETVLRYVKDAPLENLPAEVLALEGKRDLVRLISKFADGAEALSGRMEGLEAQLQKVIAEKEALVAKYEQRSSEHDALPFVTNGSQNAKGFKVHQVLLDGMTIPPQMWRTKCGFRFAFCGFTRHASLTEFPCASRCKLCGIHVPEDAGAVASPCSASESSSSSSSS